MPDYANPQSFNRYSYVRNNPLNYIDPSGHWDVEDNGDGTYSFTGSQYDEAGVGDDGIEYWETGFYDHYLGDGIFYNYEEHSIRWGQAANAGLGLLGNGLGVGIGWGLVFTPEVTGLTKCAGGLVLGKSWVGWGLNWYNFTQAFTQSGSTYDAPSSATRLGATVIAPGSQDALLFADAIDLGLDLMVGRARVRVNPLLDPPIYAPYDIVEKTFSSPQAINAFQATQAGQVIYQDTSVILDR